MPWRASALPALLLLALGLRLWGITYGLPWINRYFFESDEGTIINLAMAFGSGDLNPHSFNNPPFFMYLLFGLYGGFYALGRLAGSFHSASEFAYYYFTHLTPFYLIGRGLSALLGVASVYLVYRIGLRLFGRRAGLLAALFLCLTPLHVDLSHQVKVDVAATFFVLVSLVFAIGVLERGLSARRLWSSHLLAGAFAGVAAATKYQDGGVLLALVVAHLCSPRTASAPLVRRLADRHLWSGVAACALGFALANPFAVLDPGVFLRSLASLSREVTITAASRGFSWLPPHVADFSDFGVLGLPLLALSLLGLAYALWLRTPADLTLASYPLALYLLLSLPSYAHSRERFLLPLVPPLCLLAARALLKLAAYSRWPATIPAAVAALALIGPLAEDVRHDFLAAHKTTTVLAREWIEANLPAAVPVLMDPKQVPQLTFTPQALQRRVAIKDIPRRAALLPSRRDVLEVDTGTRGRLAALKDRALAEQGVPYDLLLLLNADEQVLPEDYYAEGIDALRQRYGIQYLVLSSWVYDYFLADPPLDQRGPHPAARAFYQSIFSRWQPIHEFVPNPFTRPGPRILIYRLG